MPEPSLRTRFGSRVKKIRSDAQVTQETLASKVRTSQRTISAIEAGKQNIKLDMIEELARALGVPERELFPGEGEITVDHMRILVSRLKNVLDAEAERGKQVFDLEVFYAALNGLVTPSQV